MPFSTFCVSKVITTAHAHKSGVIFHFFSRAFKQKKIKALRPKMTKIASGGGGPALKCRVERENVVCFSGSFGDSNESKYWQKTLRSCVLRVQLRDWDLHTFYIFTIVWIELSGKARWLPLNHDGMYTAPNNKHYSTRKPKNSQKGPGFEREKPDSTLRNNLATIENFNLPCSIHKDESRSFYRIPIFLSVSTLGGSRLQQKRLVFGPSMHARFKDLTYKTVPVANCLPGLTHWPACATASAGPQRKHKICTVHIVLSLKIYKFFCPFSGPENGNLKKRSRIIFLRKVSAKQHYILKVHVFLSHAVLTLLVVLPLLLFPLSQWTR